MRSSKTTRSAKTKAKPKARGRKASRPHTDTGSRARGMGPNPFELERTGFESQIASLQTQLAERDAQMNAFPGALVQARTERAREDQARIQEIEGILGQVISANPGPGPELDHRIRVILHRL